MNGKKSKLIRKLALGKAATTQGITTQSAVAEYKKLKRAFNKLPSDKKDNFAKADQMFLVVYKRFKKLIEKNGKFKGISQTSVDILGESK